MNCDACNGAVKDATHRIQQDKLAYKHKEFLIVCLTVLLAVSIVCATVMGCYTIREQQYALNMQYASLMEYLSNAEVSTETIDSGEGGVAAKIEGNGNTVANGVPNSAGDANG